MRLILVFLLGLLPVEGLHAQFDQALYDKINQDLRTANSDAQKMKAMLALGDYHVEQSYMEGFQRSMDTAYSIAGECEKLARKMKSNKELANTYLLLAKAMNYESKYDTCIDYAKKAVAIFTSSGDKTGLVYANRTLYQAYRYTMHPKDSRKYTEENIALALSTKNDLLCGIAYDDCAQNESHAGDMPKSADYMTKAIQFYKSAGKQDLQHCYAMLARSNSRLGQLQDAYTNITQAVTLAETYHDQTFYMAQLYAFAASVNLSLERWATAETCLRKALDVARKYVDPLTINNAAIRLSEVLRTNHKEHLTPEVMRIIEQNYDRCNTQFKLRSLACLLKNSLSLGNYKDAEKYYNKIVPMMPEIGPVERGVEPTASISDAFTSYFIYKKNPDSSQKYLNIAVASVVITNKDWLPWVHRSQFQIDSLRGNYLKAIKSLQLEKFYADSLFDLRRDGQISELEVQYDVEKRKRDNEILKRETELQATRVAKATSQKNWSLAAVALLTIIVLLIVRQYRLNQKSKKAISSQNSALEKLVSEKDGLLEEKEGLLEEKDWLLKEIHHRVKNNLQIVMSLLNTQSYFLNDNAAKEAIRNSQHRIHSMSLIHKKLYQSESVSSVNVAVYFEELIEYYKVAFDTSKRIRFTLDVDPVELDPSQAVPLGLILNETINNALKHAFPDGRNGNISIRFKSVENNQLELSVKDDGVGMKDESAISQTSSLGMKLIKGFTGELNGDLSIRSNNGMEILIRFNNNRLAE